MKKIFWLQLGCAKNQADGESVISEISDTGIEVVDDITLADVAVVNTCGFIEDAKKDSIENILDVISKKDENPNLKVVITGCLAQRYFEDLKKELVEVDKIFPLTDRDGLVDYLKGSEKTEGFHYSMNETARVYYVKISEGCDNKCSYCAIPGIRGAYTSLPIDDIIEDVKFGISAGYKEIILVGQDLASYGKDTGGSVDIVILVEKILEIDANFWLRLMYLHPATLIPLVDRFVNIFKDKRVCPYLDIPIQHFSDRILQKMSRRYTGNDVVNLIKKLKKEVKDIVVRSTLIVGFPGETDEDFEILSNFISKGYIDRLGVFTYSKEEDTEAFNFENEVDGGVAIERKNEIEAVMADIYDSYSSSIIDKEFLVLVDYKESDDSYCARSQFEAPEIDNIFHVQSDIELSEGEIYTVKVIDSDRNDFFATLV